MTTLLGVEYYQKKDYFKQEKVLSMVMKRTNQSTNASSTYNFFIENEFDQKKKKSEASEWFNPLDAKIQQFFMSALQPLQFLQQISPIASNSGNFPSKLLTDASGIWTAQANDSA